MTITYLFTQAPDGTEVTLRRIDRSISDYVIYEVRSVDEPRVLFGRLEKPKDADLGWWAVTGDDGVAGFAGDLRKDALQYLLDLARFQ